MPRSQSQLDDKDLRDADDGKGFRGLGLSDRALAAVRRAGFEHPTDIQREFIPAALTGRDCIGRAKTGTGKTAAYLLPIFEHFFAGEREHALILAPTRELAQQIVRDCAQLAGKHPPTPLAVYGGQPIHRQTERLRQKPDIIAATPGRIIDHSKRKNIAFHRFSILVIDEVDRMFDMGFRRDISYIVGRCTNRRQTMFLSATLPEDIMRFAERFAEDPIRISVVDEARPSVETLDQRYFTVTKRKKFQLLTKLLERERPERALVFTRTKRAADRVGHALRKQNVSVGWIHGDLPQTKRDAALDSFRKGRVHVLVATDVMGRGIDVPAISHVINYDIPENCEDYLHRTGRSARMNAPGMAFTFVTPDEGDELTRIEMLCNRLLEPDKIADFDSGMRKR